MKIVCCGLTDRGIQVNELIMPEGQLRYRAMIGVGGIGAGQFFAIHGNRSLTREESRGGRFLGRRDYCKLHIVSHYVGTLLGARFATIPVGRVGDDDAGWRLLGEIKEAGLKWHRVRISPGEQTLFSICLLYPDGSGGNLTTDDSASSHLDSADVLDSEEDFRRHRGAGIALALPEVPVSARTTLIRLGSDHGFLRVASFTQDEIHEVVNTGLIQQLDLISLNRDEAATICGHSPGHTAPDEIAGLAVRTLSTMNPNLLISITAGREGSWSWDGQVLRRVPAIPVPVQGTAGAGDAHLAGIIIGLAAGFGLAEAQQFGTLLAALSVTSPHTIHPDLDRVALLQLAKRSRVPLDGKIQAMLGDRD